MLVFVAPLLSPAVWDQNILTTDTMTVETKAVANIDAANLYGAGAEFNDIEQPEADWTREEEKRLIRRCGDAIYEKYQLAALIKSCYSLDSLVMPLLMLAFFALQLDRGNMYVSVHHRCLYTVLREKSEN